MSNLVVPGQPITAQSGFLKGHGTYFNEVTKGGSALEGDGSKFSYIYIYMYPYLFYIL